jgi:hypothetical protein
MSFASDQKPPPAEETFGRDGLVRPGPGRAPPAQIHRLRNTGIASRSVTDRDTSGQPPPLSLTPSARPNNKPNIRVSFGSTLSEGALPIGTSSGFDPGICDNLPFVAPECDGSHRPSKQTVAGSSPAGGPAR